MKKLLIALVALAFIPQSFGNVSGQNDAKEQPNKEITGYFDFDRLIHALGFCSDDEPLLLTTGECVSCDYKPGKSENFDILFGCEKCPKLKKKESDCVVKMDVEDKTKKSQKSQKKQNKENSSDKYKYDLVNIMGVGDNLQATLIENASGKKKNIAIGDVLDGYMIKSISLKEIVFEKDGVVQTLNFDVYD